jgi:hypothetical protein
LEKSLDRAFNQSRIDPFVRRSFWHRLPLGNERRLKLFIVGCDPLIRFPMKSVPTDPEEVHRALLPQTQGESAPKRLASSIATQSKPHPFLHTSLRHVYSHLPNIAQTAGIVVTSPTKVRVEPTAFRCSTLRRSARSSAIPAPIIARVAIMNASSGRVSRISFTQKVSMSSSEASNDGNRALVGEPCLKRRREFACKHPNLSDCVAVLLCSSRDRGEAPVVSFGPWAIRPSNLMKCILYGNDRSFPH